MADYDLSNLSVLIVDDYQPMRLILKNVLHALGIKTIAEAPGGLEALTILKSSNTDIVFADNLMEPMNAKSLLPMNGKKVDHFIYLIVKLFYIERG